jgi:hypothetical protein
LDARGRPKRWIISNPHFTSSGSLSFLFESVNEEGIAADSRKLLASSGFNSAEALLQHPGASFRSGWPPIPSHLLRRPILLIL